MIWFKYGGGYGRPMARTVPEIIFSLADVDIERIIAELVDNSIQARAEKISIRFFLSDKENDDVGIMVLDNGGGFKSIDALWDAMEIQTKNATKGPAELGKYHIGMKLAPLSRYQNLYVISIIDDKTWISRGFNSEEKGVPWDMDDAQNRNPTKPILYNSKDSTIPTSVHEQLKGLKSDRGKANFSKPADCKWKTCIIAEKRWRDVLDDNYNAVESMLEEKKFPKHLSHFLGITYQKVFEKNPNLRITIAENLIVKPYDPFLSDFTPSKIADEISKDEKELLALARIVGKDKEKEAIESKIKAAKALKKFGTLEGATYISAKFEGLKVTPFHIPETTVHKKLKGNLWDTEKPGTIAFMERRVSGAGSGLLKSENLRGFFFYRNNRLISFGQMYELGIGSNDANRIRIRIEFPGDLDEHIKVHPNKNKIDKKEKDLWDEVLQGLALLTGGSDYATPFNQNVPFFKKKEKNLPVKKKGPKGSVALFKKFEPFEGSHYPNIIALGNTNYLKYTECKGMAGCEFVHEPNDICPLWDCDICGKEKQEIGCEPGSCKHNCSHCGKTGVHSNKNCPKLCNACGMDHKGKSCPKACKKCKKEPCVCPCKRCGQTAKPCSGCCGKCNKKNEDCICSQQASTQFSIPNKETLIMWKMNKSDNIEMIKKAMEKLDISIEDLK